MSVVKEALSTQSLACMEQLRALNLSPIAAYLMNPQHGYGWRQQQAFRAIGRYKTFLFVSYLYPQILLVPTQEIDRVWHCHILHTRKYRGDCERLFGYIIDHEPDCEFWGEAKRQNLNAAFAQTQELLALFEGYFETDASPEFELHPDHAINLAEETFQSENEADKGHLHLYRSACGRPQQAIA
jgi:hypothetical protein